LGVGWWLLERSGRSVGDGCLNDEKTEMGLGWALVFQTHTKLCVCYQVIRGNGECAWGWVFNRRQHVCFFS
jgi:hypothetical protein